MSERGRRAIQLLAASVACMCAGWVLSPTPSHTDESEARQQARREFNRQAGEARMCVESLGPGAYALRDGQDRTVCMPASVRRNRSMT